MCCDKTSNNRINHLHERALRMVCNDNISTFGKLLEKISHVKNLRILATELYKTKDNLAAPIMHKMFEQRNIQYNLPVKTAKDTQISGSKNMEHCSSSDKKLRDS